jgi:uncharacterized membrane protein YedE/YeeE
MFESFTPLPSLLGGALIGAGASLMLLAHGRVLGVSGIVGGLLSPQAGEVGWRAWFLAGMLAAGAVGVLAAPSAFAYDVDRGLPALALAGLLVGFGTRLGSGCTSGHGVCGLSRLSARSLAATLTFMATGAATVWLLGGAR